MCVCEASAPHTAESRLLLLLLLHDFLRTHVPYSVRTNQHTHTHTRLLSFFSCYDKNPNDGMLENVDMHVCVDNFVVLKQTSSS